MARFKRALTVAGAALAATMIVAGAANGQATRTWVSGVGDDVNPCSRTAPCKTLAGAISKTAEGGEINAIDSGGFGPVTITKSVTIDLSPYLGGVLASSTNGVTVNAAPNADVTLRGIDFFGPGVKAADGKCTSAALNGVNIVQAGSVTVEDSRFANFSQWAVRAIPTAADAVVVMNNVDVRSACPPGGGVNLAPTGRLVRSSLRDTSISDVGTAVRAGEGSTVWLQSSTIFSNALGLDAAGGVINIFPDTQVFGNVVDGTPTAILSAAGGVGGATGPMGPIGPQGLTGPVGPQGSPAVTSLLIREKTLTARAGKPVAMTYISTASGPGTLSITRAGKVVSRTRPVVRSGIGRATWSGRAGRRTAGPGRYSVTLAVTGPDSRTSRSRVPLIIR